MTLETFGLRRANQQEQRRAQHQYLVSLVHSTLLEIKAKKGWFFLVVLLPCFFCICLLYQAFNSWLDPEVSLRYLCGEDASYAGHAWTKMPGPSWHYEVYNRTVLETLDPGQNLKPHIKTLMVWPTAVVPLLSDLQEARDRSFDFTDCENGSVSHALYAVQSATDALFPSLAGSMEEFTVQRDHINQQFDLTLKKLAIIQSQRSPVEKAPSWISRWILRPLYNQLVAISRLTDVELLYLPRAEPHDAEHQVRACMALCQRRSIQGAKKMLEALERAILTESDQNAYKIKVKKAGDLIAEKESERRQLTSNRSQLFWPEKLDKSEMERKRTLQDARETLGILSRLLELHQNSARQLRLEGTLFEESLAAIRPSEWRPEGLIRVPTALQETLAPLVWLAEADVSKIPAHLQRRRVDSGESARFYEYNLRLIDATQIDHFRAATAKFCRHSTHVNIETGIWRFNCDIWQISRDFSQIDEDLLERSIGIPFLSWRGSMAAVRREFNHHHLINKAAMASFLEEKAFHEEAAVYRDFAALPFATISSKRTD